MPTTVPGTRAVSNEESSEPVRSWPLARGRGRPSQGRPRPAPGARNGKATRQVQTLRPDACTGVERLVAVGPGSCSVEPSGGAGVRAAVPDGDGADAASVRRGGPGGTSPGVPRSRAGFSKEILRKEVIQPQVPLRLPCYDLVPITGFIFGACLAAPATSDAPRFGGLTGGVYKAQEHIHRGSADPRLLAIPASCGRVAARNPNWGAIFAISSALRPGVALSAPL